MFHDKLIISNIDIFENDNIIHIDVLNDSAAYIVLLTQLANVDTKPYGVKIDKNINQTDSTNIIYTKDVEDKLINEMQATESEVSLIKTEMFETGLNSLIKKTPIKE